MAAGRRCLGQGASITTHADTRYVGRRRPLALLEDADVERLHAAALDVLATTGVVVYSPRALDILAEHGATIDRETTVARIPAAAVEQALRTLPGSVTLCGREPDLDLPLDGEHAYLAADGCAPFVRDADGTVRESRKADVYAAARLVEALPNLSATSAIVAAQDCPPETRALHELDACLRASRKHAFVVSMKDAAEARMLLRLAEVLAGGRAELKARPLFSVIVGSVSPLHLERFGLDMAFTLAEAGIPLFLYPMPIMGATAPVTPAGVAVVNTAELLAAVTAIQLACPGAPLVHAGGPAALDMRTGDYGANTPEVLLLRAAQAHMARFYGLPAGLGWGGTKALAPGVQAAYESTAGLLLEMLAGAELLFGAGLLDSVQQLSLEELVVADEVFGMVTWLLRGITVSDDSLATDVITRVGHDGSYLSDPHTRAYVRGLWRARLSETGTLEHWQAAGAPSLERRAADRADEILAAPPPTLDPDLSRTLDELLRAAETGTLT